MQRLRKRVALVATAGVLLACQGLAMAADQVGDRQWSNDEWSVRTWIDQGTPMVAVRRGDLGLERVAEQRETIRLRYAEFDPLVAVPAVPEGLRAIDGNRAFIVQFISQPIEPYWRAIEGLGGSVERFLADQGQIVTIDPVMVDRVRALPFVRWVGEYHPAYKLDEPHLQRLTPGVLTRDGQQAGDAVSRQHYSIQTLRRGDNALDGLVQQLAAMGARIELQSPQTGRAEAWLSDDQLRTIAQRSDVLFIDVPGPAETDMNIVRQTGGADYIEAVAGFTGQGVRAEVLDSGLCQGHQEFVGLPLLLHGAVPAQSHGTAVYSIMFAQGVNTQARGLLPDAEMTIMGSYTSLGNRYVHTQELVDPAGPYRAVLQTNSWGNAQTTQYTTISAEMDDILFDMNITITQSQSNTGSQLSRPQAWAKNIVSVGGIRHYNTLSLLDDCWCNGASIGPAADGRIKPDMSYFYDNITSATCGTPTSYTQFGGTSGATPITAGHIGLLYQMWNEQVFGPVPNPGGTVFENRPEASTIKALVVNTGKRYPFASPSDDLSRDKQGWGLADVERLYDEAGRMYIVDSDDPVLPLGTNSYAFQVAAGEPDLRVSMVYKDPSGTTSSTLHRINALTLRVTSPGGVTYWGNFGLKDGNVSLAGGGPNDIDNVENVFIDTPQAGTWKVDVIALEINQDGNPETRVLDAVYSLVVAGGKPIKKKCDILVLDENSQNSYALQAASTLGNVTHAGVANFNTYLTTQPWDLVVLDMPSILLADFNPIIDYIRRGNEVIVSTWGGDTFGGWQFLAAPMGAASATSFSHQSPVGQTYYKFSGTVADAVWSGVTNPKPANGFPGPWASDGAYLAPTLGSVALAGVATSTATRPRPVWLLGNHGNTIAFSLLDEWTPASESIRLWQNAMRVLLDCSSSG
ncbi:MAG: S8 family serine peptidase, partial [Phycisphaerales bacterium JB064]